MSQIPQTNETARYFMLVGRMGRLQRDAEQYVQKHVVACVSALISQNAETWIHDSDYSEEVQEILSREDYASAAEDEGWELKTATNQSYEFHKQDWSCSGSGYLLHVEVFQDCWDASEAWQALCEQEDIEPHMLEAYEHWVVSESFARQLADAGEMVTTDLFGLTVWGRTCSGQAIHMDAVVRDIVRGAAE